jgi:hypothetical protein
MALVIGKGKTLYDVPDDILAKYLVTEDKAKEIRENLKKTKETDNNDVEGYGIPVINMGTGQTTYWGTDVFDHNV